MPACCPFSSPPHLPACRAALLLPTATTLHCLSLCNNITYLWLLPFLPPLFLLYLSHFTRLPPPPFPLLPTLPQTRQFGTPAVLHLPLLPVSTLPFACPHRLTSIFVAFAGTGGDGWWDGWAWCAGVPSHPTPFPLCPHPAVSFSCPFFPWPPYVSLAAFCLLPTPPTLPTHTPPFPFSTYLSPLETHTFPTPTPTHHV